VIDRETLLDLFPVLIDTLAACQHALTAAAENGTVTPNLARGCAMLAKLQRDRLQKILDIEKQKTPADPA
jgi:hypothetical protein